MMNCHQDHAIAERTLTASAAGDNPRYISRSEGGTLQADLSGLPPLCLGRVHTVIIANALAAGLTRGYGHQLL
jgi:hypothetical protein